MLSEDRNLWTTQQTHERRKELEKTIADCEAEIKQLENMNLMAHCREAAAIVDSWPLWKRQACGLRPLVHGDY